MKTIDCDVLIVGLGPIGAYAAWQCAQSGLDTVVIERRKKADPPSTIGAFHFEEMAFDRTLVPKPPENQIICTFPGMTVHAPDHKHQCNVQGVRTLALDLNEFINDLRDLAQKQGARIHHNVQCEALINEKGQIAGVFGKHGREKTEYRCKVVIDATGMQRWVRNQIPSMKFPGGHLDFSVYMEYWQDADTKPGDGIHSYLGPSAWTAKYPDYWIVGIGQPRPLDQVKKIHKEWSDKNFPSGKKILRSVSGKIPYAYPPPTLVDDGVVVIGDAAATNKPFNGEGIASGMKLAQIVAQELPAAIKKGATRSALWEINRRYFTDQGAKFALIRAMGLTLLDLSDEELNAAFEIGLIQPEDLRQTFLDYEIKRSVTSWAAPLGRLLLRGRMAKKYGLAFYNAMRTAKLFEKYPTQDRYLPWLAEFMKVVAK